MDNSRTITALAAGMLLSMAAALPAMGQATKPMSVRAVTDTSCMNRAGSPGDSPGMQHIRTDSLGMSRSAGRRDCTDPMPTAMGSDSLCQTSVADSVGYNSADSVSMNADALAGRLHRKAMRTNCKIGLGAGIGTDSTLWQARRDSTLPRRP